MEVFIVYSLENDPEKIEGLDYRLFFQGVISIEEQADLLISALQEDGINCKKQPMYVDSDYAKRHIKKYLTEQQNKLDNEADTLRNTFMS